MNSSASISRWLMIVMATLLLLPTAPVAAAEEPGEQPAAAEEPTAPEPDEQAEYERELERHQREIQRMQERLSDAMRRANVTTNLPQATAALEGQRRELELELAGARARREALQRELEVQSQRIQQDVKDDPVAAELAKVVEAREERHEWLRHALEAGRAGQAEVAVAAAEAAEARARLAERREQAAAAAGVNLLNEWNHQLLNLTIDIHEREARLEAVVGQLARFYGISLLNDQYRALDRNWPTPPPQRPRGRVPAQY